MTGSKPPPPPSTTLSPVVAHRVLDTQPATYTSPSSSSSSNLVNHFTESSQSSKAGVVIPPPTEQPHAQPPPKHFQPIPLSLPLSYKPCFVIDVVLVDDDNTNVPMVLERLDVTHRSSRYLVGLLYTYSRGLGIKELSLIDRNLICSANPADIRRITDVKKLVCEVKKFINTFRGLYRQQQKRTKCERKVSPHYAECYKKLWVNTIRNVPAIFLQYEHLEHDLNELHLGMRLCAVVQFMLNYSTRQRHFKFYRVADWLSPESYGFREQKMSSLICHK